MIQSLQQSVGGEPELAIDASMFDLFRAEVEAQTIALNQGLVDFEHVEKPQKLWNHL